MGFSRADRVEQLKACAMGIYEEADKIVGDFPYSQGMKVVIEFECGEYPTVRAERAFLPTQLIDCLREGVVPLP